MEWMSRALRRGRNLRRKVAAAPTVLQARREGPRRVLLHLGMNKTGSTSIQHACDGYVDAETEYLDLGEPNHNRALSLVFLDRPPRRFYASGDPEAQAAQRRTARERLEAAMNRSDRSVIVSAESLSNFPDRDSCRRVVDFFEGHARDVRALAYVRDPASFMRGHFQQVLRSGPVRLDAEHNFPAYRRRFGMWDKALDGRQLDLVAFEPAAFKGGDLLEDFAARAGIDKERLRKLPRHANVSLSAEAVACLYVLREADGAPPLRGPGRDANAHLIRLLTDFGASRFAFAPQLVEAATRAHGDEVTWIEARLGRPLPVPRDDGAMTFGSARELMAFGRSLGPTLASWLGERGLLRASDGPDTLALLRAQLARHGEARALGTRLGVGRAWVALSGALRPRRQP